VSSAGAYTCTVSVTAPLVLVVPFEQHSGHPFILKHSYLDSPLCCGFDRFCVIGFACFYKGGPVTHVLRGSAISKLRITAYPHVPISECPFFYWCCYAASPCAQCRVIGAVWLEDKSGGRLLLAPWLTLITPSTRLNRGVIMFADSSLCPG
jgi:hypothetical protein